MEGKQPALEMLPHYQDEHSEKQVKNGLFLPQNGPPHGTTVWKTAY